MDPDLLSIFDALPSLLEIATQRARSTGGYVYDIQDELREEYSAQVKAFRWSMPFRSLYECRQCGHRSTQVQHILVNPHLKDGDAALYTVELLEEDIHGIREHGLNFPPRARRFLENVSGAL